ncbi:hypothetical protein AB0D47_37910 [Streptomyces sp. NPDC048376]|uniref:hypothetical protein n=1 Tax=Streptomyces sp. NPDC048376 TaxID=3154926 RepID=UPI003448202D
MLLAAGATGCGIGATGPVQAGAPASGVQWPGDGASTVRLYFAGPYGTRPVTRSTGGPLAPPAGTRPPPGEGHPGRARTGPDHPRGARGAGRLTATTGDGTVDVVVPVEVSSGELDVSAVNQLVCTAAHAEIPGGRPAGEVDVRIHENGTRSASPWTLRCGVGGNATPVTGREASAALGNEMRSTPIFVIYTEG